MAQKGKYIYDYPRPMVTVDIVVFYSNSQVLKVLLILRANPPFEGKWALPGGFVEIEEDLYDAAIRELEEETNLRDVRLEQMYTFGKPGRDPRSRNISVVYLGQIAGELPDIKAGDDAKQAKWFETDNLPSLAFDHTDIINMAMENIRTSGAS